MESVRTENGPRQQLLLNLGNLKIAHSQRKALARRIEDILTGRQSLFDIDQDIERHARKAVDKIFAKRAWEINAQSAEENYQRVDTNSIAVGQPRSLGPEYVHHEQWRELCLDRVLRENGIAPRVLPLLEALVIGRMIEPGSERQTRYRADEHSAL